MNREEILKMESGREMDALVAEKVMGWKKDNEYSGFITNWMNKKECTGYYADTGDPTLDWKPSTNIADAWEVVEKMEADDFCYSIDCAQVTFHRWDCIDVVVASTDDKPRGISLAALLAVTEDEK